LPCDHRKSGTHSACRELAKALKKLDGLIEKKIAEEAANPMPPLFDLASSMRPIPSSPKIEGIEP
jgi:hypothetical protein